MSIRGKLLRDGAELTEGDRQKQHGSIADTFDLIAAFWNLYLAKRPGGLLEGIGAADVAEMMALLKRARRMRGDAGNRDHALDEAAYIAIAHELRGGD